MRFKHTSAFENLSLSDWAYAFYTKIPGSGQVYYSLVVVRLGKKSPSKTLKNHFLSKQTILNQTNQYVWLNTASQNLTQQDATKNHPTTGARQLSSQAHLPSYSYILKHCWWYSTNAELPFMHSHIPNKTEHIKIGINLFSLLLE